MNSSSVFRLFAATFVLAWTGSGISEATASGDSGKADNAAARPEAGAEFFLQKVHPLLEAKCFGCHGEPKDREADFDMRTRGGLLKGGESGKPGLVPSEPGQSPLFQAVLRQGKLKMPPKERNKLEADEIEIIRRWIADGAPWTEPKAGKPKWELKPEDIWAFQPLSKEVLSPESKVQSPTENSIDRFIRAKLSEKNLKPAPPADRATLIRRATYDLIGLPPTPEECEAFIKDKSANAFGKVIERLLVSPHHVEPTPPPLLAIMRR